MSKTALLAGFSSYTNLEISFRGCYSKLVFKKDPKNYKQFFFFSEVFSDFSSVPVWNENTCQRLEHQNIETGIFFFPDLL